MSSQEASTSALTITLELGGGTEFLTATKKTKKHVLRVPAQVSAGEFVKQEGIQPAVVEAATLNGKSAASDAGAADAKAKHATTMQDFIQLVCRDLIVERQGMLVEPDGSLRPGILVLINDADWELEGEMEYELQDGDHICLISTLHGG